MLDPSRGVGTYVCVENSVCCDHLDELRAKCSVDECVYHELENFVVNLTVEGSHILVDCHYAVSFVDLCLVLVTLVAFFRCITDT